MEWKCDKGSKKERDLYEKQKIKEHFSDITKDNDPYKKKELTDDQKCVSEEIQSRLANIVQIYGHEQNEWPSLIDAFEYALSIIEKPI